MVAERTGRAGYEHHKTENVKEEGIVPSSLRKIFLELDSNPPLPVGWEKCLDLKSGDIFYKDRITGTCTSKDPRKKLTSSLRNCVSAGPFGQPELSVASRKDSGITSADWAGKLSDWSSHIWSSGCDNRTNLELSLKIDNFGTKEEECTAVPKSAMTSPEDEDMNLPLEESSVCTVQKVKNALKRSHFRALTRNDSGCTNSSLSSLHALSLNLPSPSSSSFRKTRSSRSYASSNSSYSSSHSSMSFQGDDEEASSCDKSVTSDIVNRSVFAEDDESGVMVTLGCYRCLMYIMLPKANPCCPKCGSGDLLEILATPSPKRRKVTEDTTGVY